MISFFHISIKANIYKTTKMNTDNLFNIMGTAPAEMSISNDESRKNEVVICYDYEFRGEQLRRLRAENDKAENETEDEYVNRILEIAYEEDEDDAEEEEEEDEEDEEDEDEDDDDVLNMPLCKMNDAQIEKYVELIGRCPREECDEWEMLFIGGNILRYSYCKFIQWGIEGETVSNITITRATFDEITFTNYVFDNVTFKECVFNDIVLKNSTFKNCTFIDCEMDSSMVLDKSCKVTNNTEGEYDHYYARYDYEEDYDDEENEEHRYSI